MTIDEALNDTYKATLRVWMRGAPVTLQEGDTVAHVWNLEARGVVLRTDGFTADVAWDGDNDVDLTLVRRLVKP